MSLGMGGWGVTTPSLQGVHFPLFYVSFFLSKAHEIGISDLKAIYNSGIPDRFSMLIITNNLYVRPMPCPDKVKLFMYLQPTNCANLPFMKRGAIDENHCSYG